MRGVYERKPQKEAKKVTLNYHCESCKHFKWGLRTAFSDADGACILEKPKRKNHCDIACQHWERK